MKLVSDYCELPLARAGVGLMKDMYRLASSLSNIYQYSGLFSSYLQIMKLFIAIVGTMVYRYVI